MNNVPFLQQLAQQEPWRQGAGLPRSALDPTWEPGPGNLPCGGEVDWEPGTRWWFCKKCGYIGSAFTQLHPHIHSPMTFLLDSIRFFMSKRQNEEPAKVLEQMAFVAGAALRYAAVQTDIGKYVANLVTR